MKKTSLKELSNKLRRLNIPKSSIIFIHSSLFEFGIIEGGVEVFYRCIEETLPNDSTILMPAFSFNFKEVKIWYANSTKSEMGILTEYFRNLPETRRTIHPFHSISVKGKYANEFLKCKNVSSFGPGSPFEILYNMDAFNLSLGTGFVGGATYLHHTEEELKVPYRFYKAFPGEVFDENSQPVNRTFKMYVRYMNNKYVNDWDKVWKDLNKDNCFRIDVLNGAKIMLSNIKKTHDVFKKHILVDPYYASKMIRKKN